MRIYQPMLFVGLGGTGCRVGAELERLLREELCGPDGEDLSRQITDLRPYQLPGCLQFVYADLAESEFGHIERRVVPDPALLRVAERTHQMVRDLVPAVDTYPEVAQSLRFSAPAETADWLPPATGEPLIGPLSKGAGQLPTIGRAALFETFRDGLAPALDSIRTAIGEFNKSRGQLALLAGDQGRSVTDAVDVFVACSVAGGTGTGLFYDYLHLVADALYKGGYAARIFPLIVLPSAFPEGLGGGRAARLNAARALLDLFRLVDTQNASPAGNTLNARGIEGAQEIRYPGRNAVRLRPSTVQTAVLFGGSDGVQRDDLHRSMVTLVLSLIGSDLTRDDGEGRVTTRNFQSFADSFINDVDRGTPAPAGVGRRGVSTSSVASLTVPVEDLATLIGSRMLADAVTELDRRAPGENNRDLVRTFFGAANLDELWTRAAPEAKDPPAATGMDRILAALNVRKRNHELALTTLDKDLEVKGPALARAFDPAAAVRSALTGIDLFRLRRVVAGDPSFDDEVSKLGLIRVLQRRRARPNTPAGLSDTAPTPRIERTRWVGRLRWSDEPVRESYKRQTEWFEWRSKVAWHAAWNDQAARWEPPLRALGRDVDRIVQAFLDHAAGEQARFSRREKDLYETRTGVSYLLPRQGRMQPFYESVVRRFVAVLAEQGRLAPAATVGDLVGELLGDQGWRQAWDLYVEHGGERAVAHVRDLLVLEVRRMFGHSDSERRPLLAGLGDLLAAASGRDRSLVDDDDLLQFREKLAGLVPGGYAPSGGGRMKILFTYPSVRRDPQLESYLEQTVTLPRAADTVIEWRALDAQLVSVVMFRSSMGLTEVPEVQDVLREWSDAIHHPRDGDFLPWRQRLDHRFGYLAANHEDRVRMLHHLLCAAWNGGITPTGGTIDSPKGIVVALNEAGVRMELRLTPFGDLSSWGSVLSAYEEWVLADNEPIRRQFAAELVRTVPAGVTGRPRPPHAVFVALLDAADDQRERIDAQLAEGRPGRRRRLELLREFWTETLPAALQREFTVVDPVEDNLAALYEWTRRAGTR
jgi:hypothetical protein